MLLMSINIKYCVRALILVSLIQILPTVIIMVDSESKLTENRSSGIINTTKETEEEDLIRATSENITCGHVAWTFNDSNSDVHEVFLRDRELENLKLQSMYGVPGFIFHSENVKPGCEMRICGSHTVSFKEDFVNFCHTFIEAYNPEEKPVFKNIHVQLISCSCKNANRNCHTTFCSEVVLKEHECGRLYSQESCNDCRYDSISMAENENITMDNGFVVHSLVVRDGCSIRRDYWSRSKLEKARFTYITYKQRNANIAAAYYGEAFYCTCEDHLATELMTSKLSAITAIIVALMIVMTVVITSLCYVNRKKKLYESRFLIPEEEVRIFTEGISNESGIEEEGKSETDGYLKALLMPYSKRFEVSRKYIKIEEDVVLGKGQYGMVTLGKLKLSNGSYKDVAVKMIKENGDLHHLKSLLTEIKIMGYIGVHSNIVNLLGACTRNIRQREVFLIMELCSNGSLKSFMQASKQTFIPLGERATDSETWSDDDNYLHVFTTIDLLRWSKEIADAMNFLSTKKVIHVDLAARNILLTESYVAKIGDFGLSRRLSEIPHYIKQASGDAIPFKSMAPESLKQLKFSVQTDIWSYGVTLWEIFTLGDEPYEDITDYNEVVSAICNGKQLPKPEFATIVIYEKILKCCTAIPEDRPSFKDLKTFFEIQESELMKSESNCPLISSTEDNKFQHSYVLFSEIS